ncbi:MAG: LamG-like jellyroll fold domain-containing protein [Sedimentisphaeraceae bacterium JB056]
MGKYRVFLILCLVMFISTVVFGDIESDLAGYWMLDGNISDSSGNGLDLNAAGSGGNPIPNGNGVFNGCYEFSNTAAGAQVLFQATTVDVSDSVTVTAWINPSVLQAGFTATSPHTIAKLYLSTSSSSAMDFRIRDNNLDVYYTNPAANKLSSLTVPANEWSFVAVTQTGTSLTVYLNDQKQTFAVDGSQAYNRIMLGSTGATTARGITGYMDEVRFYKRALTDAEILEVYSYDPTVSDITSDLYGYWPLDGDWSDQSGYGLDLISVGTAPVVNANGAVGSCYEFDNAASGPSMLAAMTTSVDPNDPITITGWINPSVLTDGFTTTSPHTIVRMYDSPATANVLDFRIRDGMLDVYYKNPSLNLSSGLSVPENQWSFVAIIQDGTSIKFYLNDTYSSEFTVDGGQMYNRFLIGGIPNTSRGLTGLLDDVRVYKRALSTVDLQALYNYVTPEPDIATDMCAYWHLDGDMEDSGPLGIEVDVTPEFGDPNEIVVSANGHLGECYQFDTASKGLQVITTPNGTLNIPTDGVTATAWIKPYMLQDGFTETSPHNIVWFTYFDGENYSNATVLRIRDGKLEAYYSNPASNNISDFEIPLDTWSFVAVTQFNNTLTVYFNDQKQTFSVDGPMEYSEVRLGGQMSLPRGMNGLLDEVRIYKRALSDIDIAEIYALQYRESDINQNGVVGIEDFAAMSDSWLTETDAGSLGDINFDGFVNTSDLSIMVKYWLETTLVN